ncbi:MAG: ABC transporter [Ruminococcaceae bacterium]|nr:ABC transporter [Oscillospiraceae bacterium]
MNAVYRKELRSSLLGMTGPIFIFAVLAILGFFIANYQFSDGNPHFEFPIVEGSFWSLLLAPVLTMRSFSEERKTKTDQLLYALPISTTAVVMGKYLAMVTVFAIPCAVICAYPIIVSFFAPTGINLFLAYGSIFAYFLLGCAVIAIGMLISSLFESQVICAIVNLVVILGCYFITANTGAVSDSATTSLVLLIGISLIIAVFVYFTTGNLIAAGVSGLVLIGAAAAVYFINSELYTGLSAKILSALFIFRPISAFAYETFDITCFVYYLSIAALFVFFTVQSFEKRRWN